MIIDSHAHYNNNAYKKPFRYLSYDKYGYTIKEGKWEQLSQELVDANIPYSIEPGVSLQSCEEVLQLCAEYPDRIFPAMGIHPTRSIYEKCSDRKKLDAFAKMPGVIAIGECGLDYHYKREDMFYVGHQGQFDAYVHSELKKLKQEYPQINYAVVLAYLPGKKTEHYDYSDTMLPEGIESVHPHYAISWRNNWMLKQSDYVVTYITHSWGGAAQYSNKAKTLGKTVVNLFDLRCE